MNNDDKRKAAKAVSEKIAARYATKADRLKAAIIAHDAALMALESTGRGTK